MELINLLLYKREDLKEIFSQKADYYGNFSYLFMPQKKCVNDKICLVAHIDTVFDYWNESKNKHILYNSKKKIYTSPQGLGADDRAGVYACLKIREITGAMVLLTDYEENGAFGAEEACVLYKDIFKNVNFFIEIDRKGNREAVYYNNEPQYFKDYINSFGFQEKRGIFTDISVICKTLNKLGVNLSAGYYNPHAIYEFLNVSHLENTIKNVIKIVNDSYNFKICHRKK